MSIQLNEIFGRISVIRRRTLRKMAFYVLVSRRKKLLDILICHSQSFVVIRVGLASRHEGTSLLYATETYRSDKNCSPVRNYGISSPCCQSSGTLKISEAKLKIPKFSENLGRKYKFTDSHISLSYLLLL